MVLSKIRQRYFLQIFLVVSLLGCQSKGGHWQHFRYSALEEAWTRNMTIFLHFDDSTCSNQKSILEKMIEDKKFAKVGAYRLKWNDDPKLQKALDVTAPCTLLIYKGESLKLKTATQSESSLKSALLLGF